ncbi:MAG: homocysteine S-methyltransferase [Candidatus Promineifilaceae bacterium]
MLNPIRPFLETQDALILDGGLATQLEARGCDLSDKLWSARLLMDNPDFIRQVHLDYYLAGADVGISASYQATLQGFQERGATIMEAIQLLRLSVQLVTEARAQFWAQPAARRGRLYPLVAASVGPYGAFLANGAEYTGRYDLDEDGLFEFHRQRWHILAGTEADLMACETIPSAPEMRALVRLLLESGRKPAWFSFTARDEAHISDGTAVAEIAAFLDNIEPVVAVGINCTPPSYIPGLIREIRSATSKPIIVYPNSGEQYDAVHKCWLGESDPSAFGTFSREWRKEGAMLIGGCCRTTPAHIRQIADRMRRGGDGATK